MRNSSRISLSHGLTTYIAHSHEIRIDHLPLKFRIAQPWFHVSHFDHTGRQTRRYSLDQIKRFDILPDSPRTTGQPSVKIILCLIQSTQILYERLDPAEAQHIVQLLSFSLGFPDAKPPIFGQRMSIPECPVKLFPMTAELSEDRSRIGNFQLNITIKGDSFVLSDRRNPHDGSKSFSCHGISSFSVESNAADFHVRLVLANGIVVEFLHGLRTDDFQWFVECLACALQLPLPVERIYADTINQYAPSTQAEMDRQARVRLFFSQPPSPKTLHHLEDVLNYDRAPTLPLQLFRTSDRLTLHYHPPRRILPLRITWQESTIICLIILTILLFFVLASFAPPTISIAFLMPTGVLFFMPLLARIFADHAIPLLEITSYSFAYQLQGLRLGTRIVLQPKHIKSLRQHGGALDLILPNRRFPMNLIRGNPTDLALIADLANQAMGLATTPLHTPSLPRSTNPAPPPPMPHSND